MGAPPVCDEAGRARALHLWRDPGNRPQLGQAAQPPAGGSGPLSLLYCGSALKGSHPSQGERSMTLPLSRPPASPVAGASQALVTFHTLCLA